MTRKETGRSVASSANSRREQYFDSQVDMGGVLSNLVIFHSSFLVDSVLSSVLSSVLRCSVLSVLRVFPTSCSPATEVEVLAASRGISEMTGMLERLTEVVAEIMVSEKVAARRGKRREGQTRCLDDRPIFACPFPWRSAGKQEDTSMS